jgi:hypothetical protein
VGDDLVAFITARLDEDEAVADAGARRAGMPWRAGPQPGTPGGLVIDDLGLVGSTGGRYAADHIARHDPARVLREVVAKRALVKRHRPEVAGYGPLEDDLYCKAESSDEDLWYAKPWPCTDILALAAIYSDHPDYREEWKP